MEGVTGTETMVVLSTHTERTRIALPLAEAEEPRRARSRGGARLRRVAAGGDNGAESEEGSP
jgi:hypothetical protein